METPTLPKYTYSDLDENKYTSTIINIRDNPSTNSNIIGSLNIYKQIHIIGKCNETNWYKIDYNNGIGFASDKYIIDEIPKKKDNTDSNNIKETIDNSTASTTLSNTAYNDIIYADGTISINMLEKLNNKLSLVPSNIMAKFKEEKWIIKMTDKNIGDLFFNGAKGICGATSTPIKSIYIANTNHAINAAIIHEFGHYLDYYNYDSISSETDEFNNIYNTERYNVKGYFSDVNNSDISDVHEYFATCFYCYIMYGNQLQAIAPNSYSYIINKINAVL